MKLLNNKAKNQISDYIIGNYPTIEVKPGKCRFNYKCQKNAVHDAIENNEDKIAMCVYFDGNPIIHFININENGKYIDNTLGHWSSAHHYYLIKTVDKNHFFSADEIFASFRNDLRRQLTPLVRLLSDFEC